MTVYTKVDILKLQIDAQQKAIMFDEASEKLRRIDFEAKIEQANKRLLELSNALKACDAGIDKIMEDTNVSKIG